MDERPPAFDKNLGFFCIILPSQVSQNRYNIILTITQETYVNFEILFDLESSNFLKTSCFHSY